MSEDLRAPFPRFGGKRSVAADVWAAFGAVANYVEPFAGTCAVLLARPDFDGSQTETVNDSDCYLANFWRALAADPDAVAAAADWPVNEVDLHARHAWLVRQGGFRERMMVDPDHYDTKIAGWWVWGCCSWIGSGWCDARWYSGGPEGDAEALQRGDGQSPSRELPHIGDAGRGIHRKLPHIGNAGRGDGPLALLRALSDRLRRVRVACGDWSRVTGDSATWRHGLTGVFLDPPYPDGASDLYSDHDKDLFPKVRAWAIEAAEHPKMRIALCGYEGGPAMPPTWREHAWKARGGYGSQREDGSNENAKRERIWFSPACIRPEPPRQGDLFGRATAEAA